MHIRYLIDSLPFLISSQKFVKKSDRFYKDCFQVLNFLFNKSEILPEMNIVITHVDDCIFVFIRVKLVLNFRTHLAKFSMIITFVQCTNWRMKSLWEYYLVIYKNTNQSNQSIICEVYTRAYKHTDK